MTLSPLARRAALSGAAVLLLLGFETGVGAQNGPSSRAFDRLFTAGDTNAPGGLSMTVYQGLDSIDGASGINSGLATGPFVGISPSISLGASRGAGTFGVNGGTAVRRYSDTGQFVVADANVGFGAQFTGRRSGIRFRQAIVHANYYNFLTMSGGFAEALAAPAESSADRAGYDRSVTTYISSVDFARQLSRTVMLSGKYAWHYRNVGPTDVGADDFADLQTHDVSARLSRQMGRHSVLFAGYGTRIGNHQTDGARPLRAHDINLGIDRSQQVSFSRKTTLQFSTGSSIVEVGAGRRFFLVGSAALRHDLSRTWSAGASVRRGVAYLEGIREPVFTDAFTMTLGGAIGSRVDFFTQGGYSKGDIGLESVSSGFAAYTGSMRLRALLTKHLALYGEWTAYRHRFDPRAGLPDAFERDLLRQGFRAGVMMNVPLQSHRGAR